MTDAELIDELINRKALIVHCSRPGKGDEGINELLFPADLTNAIHICANQSKELCCSVIWPGHVETFGDVGIILKPRSTASITLISNTDGGTRVDPATGKRVGIGEQFSPRAVMDTFANAADYNEWNVQDADTVGIFMKLPPPVPQVAKIVDITQIEGYDPTMGTDPMVLPVNITLAEIRAAFPKLPVFTIEGGDIVEICGATANPYF